MKIAATTRNGGLQDVIVPQFGRAPTFTIVELKDGEIRAIEVIDNPAAEQLSGAGVAAAQLMVDRDVQVVLTGNIGPKAMSVLKAAKIKMYAADGMTVQDAIKKLMAGDLSEISTPSGRGMGRGGGRRWR